MIAWIQRFFQHGYARLWACCSAVHCYRNVLECCRQVGQERLFCFSPMLVCTSVTMPFRQPGKLYKSCKICLLPCAFFQQTPGKDWLLRKWWGPIVLRAQMSSISSGAFLLIYLHSWWLCYTLVSLTRKLYHHPYTILLRWESLSSMCAKLHTGCKQQ